MRFRNGTRRRTTVAIAVACAVFLLAGLGTSAGAQDTEPDVTVFHDGLTTSDGFEEFEGCPVIMGPDAAGLGFCLRLDVSGPLNFGDVDADVEPPMTMILGLRAGRDDTPPYIAVAPGEDGDPEQVEGGLLGFEELADLLNPVDDVARDVAGAPVYNIDADADIADPDAQIDELVGMLALFGDLAPFFGVDEGEVVTIEDLLASLGVDADEFIGDQTIGLPISIQLQNLLFGENCYIGTPDDRININLTTGTTDPPEGVEPMEGDYGSLVYEVPDEDRPFNTINRILGASFVDNTFAVPGASGCDAVVGGLLEQDQGLGDPLINQQAGLPSAAGNNVADFNIDFSMAYTDSVYQRLWTGTPTDIDLGEVLVGESSAPQTIVVENTGDRPTEFGRPSASPVGVQVGDQFTWDEEGTEGNTCTGQILEVGDQCQVTVRGTPTRTSGDDAQTTWRAKLGFLGSAGQDGAGDATEQVDLQVTAIAP